MRKAPYWETEHVVEHEEFVTAALVASRALVGVAARSLSEVE